MIMERNRTWRTVFFLWLVRAGRFSISHTIRKRMIGSVRALSRIGMGAAAVSTATGRICPMVDAGSILRA